MNKTIEKALSICGSRKVLAEKCGVSDMTVGNWLKGDGINGKYIQLISDATDGKVTVTEILSSLSER
ncbi:YdaS family helix-turn-helix protein [Mannheimia sp. AT1]|uniref:YdaS family helix-turn-helix protein n=1 Tax=Mannheimia cairinae TaxID=3025936 RepID=A0ABT5MRF8_9PAST|nr:YdaS family helix-turn-helix protein [Mannheimia cairinae]MDD0826441.1 YdaS family helix-turn-helix protein [Mannheimia cairinae]